MLEGFSQKGPTTVHWRWWRHRGPMVKLARGPVCLKSGPDRGCYKYKLSLFPMSA